IWDFTRRPVRLTSSNAKALVQQWLDRPNLTVKRLPQEGNETLSYEVTLQTNRRVVVTSTDRLLVFRARLFTDEATDKRVNALTELQKDALVRTLQLEMSRAKISFRNVVLPLNDVLIFATIPIPSDLTDIQFFQRLDQIDFAIGAFFAAYEV